MEPWDQSTNEPMELGAEVLDNAIVAEDPPELGPEIMSDISGAEIAADAPVEAEISAGKGRTLRQDAWRRLRKNKLAVAGLIWIIIVIIIALSADLWVPRYFGDPTAIDSTKVAHVRHRPARP